MRKIAVWLTCIVALGGAPAHAHTREAGDLLVHHPWAEVGKAGGSTRLRMQVLNETPNDYHILGVTSPVAAGTRIFVSIGTAQYRQVQTLSVFADESLRLDTTHLVVELVGLKRDLKNGDRFKAMMHFVNGARLTIDVLVADMKARHDEHDCFRC